MDTIKQQRNNSYHQPTHVVQLYRLQIDDSLIVILLVLKIHYSKCPCLII